MLERSAASILEVAQGRAARGNLAGHLVPPASTVYVDDVTISLAQ
jgi:hypothetical protein